VPSNTPEPSKTFQSAEVRGIYSHYAQAFRQDDLLVSFNPLKCAASIPTPTRRRPRQPVLCFNPLKCAASIPTTSIVECLRQAGSFQSAEVRGIYSHHQHGDGHANRYFRFNPLKCAASIPTQPAADRQVVRDQVSIR